MSTERPVLRAGCRTERRGRSRTGSTPGARRLAGPDRRDPRAARADGPAGPGLARDRTRCRGLRRLRGLRRSRRQDPGRLGPRGGVRPAADVPQPGAVDAAAVSRSGWPPWSARRSSTCWPEHAGMPVNGQSGGILPILTFGVGTDYALLLIARYREELRDRSRPARRDAAQPCGGRHPRSLASAATVVLGLSCLMLADLNSTRSLGAVGAVADRLCGARSPHPAAHTAGAVRAVGLLALRAAGRTRGTSEVPAAVRHGGERVADAVSRRPRGTWAGDSTAC